MVSRSKSDKFDDFPSIDVRLSHLASGRFESGATPGYAEVIETVRDRSLDVELRRGRADDLLGYILENLRLNKNRLAPIPPGPITMVRRELHEALKEDVDSLDIPPELRSKREALLGMADDFLAELNSQTVAGNPLRLTQKIAVAGFVDWIKKNADRRRLMGHIVHPFGSGKTYESVLISQMAPERVLVIGFSNLDQIYDSFVAHERTFPEDERRCVGKCYGSNSNTNAEIIVTNFCSDHKWDGIDWNSVDMIMVDEADVNALSRRRAALLRRLADTHAIPIVAFTATEEQGSGKKLSDVFPDQISRLSVPDALPQALEMGIIPPMTFSDLYLDLEFEVDLKAEAKREDFSDEAVREFIGSSRWVELILEDYLERFEGLPKAMIIFRDNQLLDQALEACSQMGIRAATYTGELSDAERQERRRQLVEGEIDMLLGSELLGRGLHIPEVKVVYNSTLTRSPQRFWQAEGRAASLDSNDPDKHPHVIALLPGSIIDRVNQRSLSLGKQPLCHAEFFRPDYFAGIDEEVKRFGFAQDPAGFYRYLSLREMKEGSFDLGQLNFIRSIHEVVTMRRALNRNPEGYEWRTNVLTDLIASLNGKISYGFIMRLIRSHTSELIALRDKCAQSLPTIISEFEVEEMPRSSQLLIQQCEFAPALSSDKEKELIAKALSGDGTAISLLLSAYLPLVCAMAKNMYVPGFDMGDFVGVTLDYLSKAIAKKDQIRGGFSAYVMVGSFHAMRRMIQDESRDVRLPINVQEDCRVRLKLVDQLRSKARGECYDPGRVALEELDTELHFGSGFEAIMDLGGFEDFLKIRRFRSDLIRYLMDEKISIKMMIKRKTHRYGYDKPGREGRIVTLKIKDLPGDRFPHAEVRRALRITHNDMLSMVDAYDRYFALEKSGKIEKARRKIALEYEAGERPYIEHIPEADLRKSGLTKKSALKIRQALLRYARTNQTFCDDDFFDGDIPDSPEDFIQREQLKEIVRLALSNLRPIRRAILEMSFGISGVTEMTVEQIAKHFSLTSNRVRLAYYAALREVRCSFERLLSRQRAVHLRDGISDLLDGI